MMLPTHVLAGMLLAAPLVRTAPELAPVGFAAGFLGGLVPDLDMYTGHRRTLHYPVYYSVLSVPALLAAVLATSAATVAVALFLLGAALHSVADMYGGGLELRPWEGNSDRAVYDHHRGTWISPRRGVRYDGAVEDLALCAGLSVPLLLLVEPPLRAVVIGTLAVALVYTALRRRLAEIAALLIPLLPDALDPYLPERYR
nr:MULTISPECIES: metal-dependent hydrolase [Halorubrum]